MTSPRKTYIIANWKMNFTPGEASLYLHRLEGRIKPARNIQIILAPSTVSLQPLSLQVNRRQFKLAAQNLYWRDYGAFTGETSASQIRGFVDYAIIGHSERRYIFNESEEDIAQKVAAALRNNITPILCIGETAIERKDGETAATIYSQLANGLNEVSSDDISKVIIAYEPVWAISSNKDSCPAKLVDIEEAQALIRRHISKLYSKEAGNDISVLYGGSVTHFSAGSYLSIKGIDGLLIGGARLIADSFCAIVTTAKGIKYE